MLLEEATRDGEGQTNEKDQASRRVTITYQKEKLCGVMNLHMDRGSRPRFVSRNHHHNTLAEATQRCSHISMTNNAR